MKQMKHVLAIGAAVCFAMASAVPLAEAHHGGGISSFGVSHSHGNHGHSSYGNYQRYYVQHRHNDHYGHDYYDGYYDGDNYGFGGDCGWLHCHTAMPWG